MFEKSRALALLTHEPNSLAWAEMYLFLAAIVPRFSFRIEHAKASDFEMERDNFGIGTKAGCNLTVGALD